MLLQVENAKKTLILHGTKTSGVVKAVLMQIYHMKRDNAVKYTKKNENIRAFESGGETSLEFFSLKTDCSLFVVSETFHLCCFPFYILLIFKLQIYWSSYV